ncbi:MAG TPA: fluoride efflux transporter CrcB [Acetobacteraceae bacterium]|jgi:CrcB protein|nr:fluoride efflux transporter CrcB [Acetobacteraceae bacterium]
MLVADLTRTLWVALGGALGSIARYGIAEAMVRLTGPRFPWGILLINVVGSFIIGYFGAFSARSGRLPVPIEIRVFVMVGICGGFTTFSSFSLQTFDLLRSGENLLAGLNIVGSVVLCLAAVWLGVTIAQP